MTEKRIASSELSLMDMIEALAQDDIRARLYVVDAVMHIIEGRSWVVDYLKFLHRLDESGLYEENIVRFNEIVCDENIDRFILLVKSFRLKNGQIDHIYFNSQLKIYGFNDVDIEKIKMKLDLFLRSADNPGSCSDK